MRLSRDRMVRWLVALIVLALSGAGAWAQASTEGAPDALAADALIAEVEAMWTSGDKGVIEAKLREALGLRMLALGDDDLAVADVLGRLGRNEWNRQRWAEAEAFFARALAIAEPKDPVSAETARLIGDYAAALRETGKPYAAEQRARQSIDLRRKLLLPDDPWIAAGLENLTLTLLRAGRFAEAEEAAREGLAIRQATFGPAHEATLRSARQLETAEAFQLPWWDWKRVGWRSLAHSVQWAIPAWIASMLIFLVMWHPWVEARTPNRLHQLGLVVLIAAVLLGGYVFAIAGAFFTAGWFLDFYHREGSRLNVLFGAIGAVATSWLLFRLRWILAGRPPPPVDPVVEFAAVLKTLPQVRRAINVGWIWVMLPALLIMILCFAVPIVVAKWSTPSGWTIVIVCAGMAAGFLLSWLWWSVWVPHWQIWSLRRIEEIDFWEQAAIRDGVLNSRFTPWGRFFCRTEWWTPALRAEAHAIIAARWPGRIATR